MRKRIRKDNEIFIPGEKRNIIINFGLISLSGFFILLIISAYLFIRSDFFVIRNLIIKLDKIECASESSIKEVAGILGQNFFFLNSLEIKKKFDQKFICIKNINFIKHFPDAIELQISGRIPIALLINTIEATNSYTLEDFISTSSSSLTVGVSSNLASLVVDEEGVIFSDDTGKNLPRIFFEGEKLEKGKKLSGGGVKKSIQILNKMTQLGTEVNDAKIYSQGLLLISGKPKIVFSLDGSIDVQLASLQLILDKAKIENEIVEFLDLRFDKPIVKYGKR